MSRCQVIVMVTVAGDGDCLYHFLNYFENKKNHQKCGDNKTGIYVNQHD